MNVQEECQRIVNQINALGGDVSLVLEGGPLPADMVPYLQLQLAIYERFEAEDAARLWELAGRFTELRLAEGTAQDKMPQITGLAVFSAVLMDGRREVKDRKGVPVSVMGLLPEISNLQIKTCMQTIDTQH